MNKRNLSIENAYASCGSAHACVDEPPLHHDLPRIQREKKFQRNDVLKEPPGGTKYEDFMLIVLTSLSRF